MASETVQERVRSVVEQTLSAWHRTSPILDGAAREVTTCLAAAGLLVGDGEAALRERIEHVLTWARVQSAVMGAQMVTEEIDALLRALTGAGVASVPTCWPSTETTPPRIPPDDRQRILTHMRALWSIVCDGDHRKALALLPEQRALVQLLTRCAPEEAEPTPTPESCGPGDAAPENIAKQAACPHAGAVAVETITTTETEPQEQGMRLFQAAPTTTTRVRALYCPAPGCGQIIKVPHAD